MCVANTRLLKWAKDLLDLAVVVEGLLNRAAVRGGLLNHIAKVRLLTQMACALLTLCK